MAHLAKNLSPEQRIMIEGLLGRAIAEQEAITILAYEPPPPVPDQKRYEVLERLKAYFAEVDAKRPPVSPEEAQEAFEEAMRSSRPNYREHR